jgi:Carboxypeptidase regulatory-like domain
MFSLRSQWKIVCAVAAGPRGMMNLKTTTWALLALVLLLPSTTWAQATGAIIGTVTDPSGAVIPGAKITATRVETGVSQSTVTSGAGTYTIPNLVVGNYNITAEGQGFKGAVCGASWAVGRRLPLRRDEKRVYHKRQPDAGA